MMIMSSPVHSLIGMSSQMSDASFDLLRRLDLFFGSSTITSEVAAFFDEHAGDIEFLGPEEEQPLTNHRIYEEYQRLMEGHLALFLEEERVEASVLLEAASEAVNKGQQQLFTALDYLLSLDDYDTFIDIAWSHGMNEGHVDEED